MRIYMDACCLNRPFDDLSQARNYFEAEAILSIISRCENGEWSLISSGIIDYELSRISDSEKSVQIQDIYSCAAEHVELTQAAEKRAAYFREHGIKLYDSLHLALAEESAADVLLTTDDKFLKRANELTLTVKVFNPVKFFMGGMDNE